MNAGNSGQISSVFPLTIFNNIVRSHF